MPKKKLKLNLSWDQKNECVKEHESPSNKSNQINYEYDYKALTSGVSRPQSIMNYECKITKFYVI